MSEPPSVLNPPETPPPLPKQDERDRGGASLLMQGLSAVVVSAFLGAGVAVLLFLVSELSLHLGNAFWDEGSEGLADFFWEVSTWSSWPGSLYIYENTSSFVEYVWVILSCAGWGVLVGGLSLFATVPFFLFSKK